MTPPIGQIVFYNGRLDWVCQRRLGDEQFVLWWGAPAHRYSSGDEWTQEEP